MSQTKTFYATFGSGQVGYPGYLECTVPFTGDVTAAELMARVRIHDATGGKWCGLYDSLDKMHVADKVYRGKC